MQIKIWWIRVEAMRDSVNQKIGKWSPLRRRCCGLGLDEASDDPRLLVPRRLEVKQVEHIGDAKPSATSDVRPNRVGRCKKGFSWRKFFAHVGPRVGTKDDCDGVSRS